MGRLFPRLFKPWLPSKKSVPLLERWHEEALKEKGPAESGFHHSYQGVRYLSEKIGGPTRPYQSWGPTHQVTPINVLQKNCPAIHYLNYSYIYII